MDQRDYEKINGYKDDYRKKRTSWALPIAIVAVLALIGVSTWGYYQNKQLTAFRMSMNNQYSRAFAELTGYVDNMEVLLTKSMVTSTPQSTSNVLGEIWRQANLAQTNMGQLPVSPPVLEKTSNFLTQVGDFAYALSNKAMTGKAISNTDFDNLQKMHGYAASLQKSLHGIQDMVANGKMNWGSAQGPKQINTKSSKLTQTSQLENIDKNFQEYPTLIYDGPYSDQTLNTKPVGLKQGNVDANAAENIVRKMIGNDKIQSINRLDDIDQGGIQAYRFKVNYKNQKDDESAEVDITKQGGQVYSLLRNRPVPNGKVTMKVAEKAALDFLDNNGFPSMKPTYFTKNDGVVTICFAYSQDGVTVYPDLVKVNVALDNTEILGVDAKSYLFNHTKRDIPTAKYTMAEARNIINQKLSIESQGRAIIPTTYKSEKYCYQFQGKVGDQKFIVYINALTGAEEDVLLLMDTKDGTLVM